MNDLCVIILAAGKGKRMGGETPKVLRKIKGTPILGRILKTVNELQPQKTIIITGYKNKLIENFVQDSGYKAITIKQKKLLGTAHALNVGLKSLFTVNNTILVLFGDDSGLYKPETIKAFINNHLSHRKVGSVMIYRLNKPTEIGALVLDKDRNVIAVQTKESMEQKNIKENYALCGAMCFEGNWIKENIHKIKRSETSGEYPLPSIFKIARNQKQKIGTFILKDKSEWSSVNTPKELSSARNKAEII